MPAHPQVTADGGHRIFIGYMLYENLEISGSLRGDRVTYRPPRGLRSARPASPRSGSLYLEQSDSGSFLMMYTGISNIDDGWEMVSAQEERPTTFKYRQIIQYSYLAGGYKNASPWRNVHKTTNSTDQTTHIGELLDYPISYTSGACSKTIFFVWSVNEDNAFKGPADLNGTRTSAINMINDTNYAHQTKFNIAYTRSDCATIFKETEFAWIFAGNRTEVEKFNLTNESLVTSYAATSINSGDGAGSFSDENNGYVYSNGGNVKMNLTTETISSIGVSLAAHGQQKGISSKVGKGYAGNEGSYNGGYNLRRWDLSTDTNIGNVAKPHPNCGEENFTMGQDWQYMLGNYDGSGQNNVSWKFFYATDVGSTSITGLAPGVNAGTSSGHCGWRQ
jgi:hypothetical protein